MDVVMDLTSRAVTFIGVVQELCVKHVEELKADNEEFHMLEPSSNVIHLLKTKAAKNLQFQQKSIETIWINNQHADVNEVTNAFINRAVALFEWIWQQDNLKILKGDTDSLDALPSAENWRTIINKLLYQQPKERTELAGRLHYLPVIVILALGGGHYNAKEQRILQEWGTTEDDLKVLVSTADLDILNKCKNFDPACADQALESEYFLLQRLNELNIPLPFEYILSMELTEIEQNREKRDLEQYLASNKEFRKQKAAPEKSKKSDVKKDSAINKAGYLNLTALAFSGGGIRSATFNLGILQGIAKSGLLHKFDYLSTVSGGGYIGSWLVTWIKREGSVKAVGDHLNPDKSSDPLAEEVRPIRWLRMFSNYLSPNSSFMSVDSWTVGMTILRNMLLNQLIILLLLFTLLLSGRLLFIFWSDILTTSKYTSDIKVFLFNSAIIIAGAIIAGLGMRAYHKNKIRQSFSHTPNRDKVSVSLIALACIISFVVSAWLFSKDFPAVGTFNGFLAAFDLLKEEVIVIFIALISVAVLGRYDQCIPHTGFKKFLGNLFVVIASAISAIAGVFFLTVGWELIQIIGHPATLLTAKADITFPNVGKAMAFTFGFPIMLEVLSLTVVTRMALLGKYFPDERREWWGRIGGVIHQLAFLWILIAGAALLGRVLLDKFNIFGSEIIVTAGGWAALVFTAVKAAFSSKSDNNEPTVLSKALNILALFGPYLFGLGLLCFLPILLNKLLSNLSYDQQTSFPLILLITTGFGFATFMLAWRIGVNEFSMHHFYKNRLLRAYLGATRRRTDRKKTANSFTGFDTNDDILLPHFTHAHGYHGPFPIINTTLNASQVLELDRQDRKAESFIFSPLYCGFDFSRTRPSVSVNQKSYDYAYRPTAEYAYPNGPHIGSAVAISGAAANPNMGYHSSPATAFLLTAFNLRLGWWIGNPRKNHWRKADPVLGLAYLVSDLTGKSDTDDDYVCLSDGGHFDNMGLYELVRRRVSLIILGDGEQDNNFTCEGLANAIRRCRIDFGVEIEIDVTPITNRTGNVSEKNFAIGKIKYPNYPKKTGTLIYLKSSITKTLSVDVREYASKNPTFPHQSTGDQFFDEEQFESYRKLGLAAAESALADVDVKAVLQLNNTK